MAVFIRILVVWVLLAISATAQVTVQPIDPPAADTSAEADPADDPAQLLADILKDDTARAALIAELERTADVAPPPEDVVEEEPTTFGRRVAQVVTVLADRAVDEGRQFWRGLQRVPDTLTTAAEAIDAEALGEALRELGFVILVTYSVFLSLMLLTRWPVRRLVDLADGAGLLIRAIAVGVSVAMGLIVIFLASGAGYTLSSIFGSDPATVGSWQLLYLTAFTIVQIARTLTHAVLSPRHEALRLFPLPTVAARIIWRWAVVAIAILCYGLFLVVPIVRDQTGFFVARAISTSLASLIVVFTMIVVMRHRRAVAAWIRRTSKDTLGGQLVSSLAGVWHLPILAYLIWLLSLVLRQAGDVLLPALTTTAQVIGTGLIGWMVIDALGRLAKRGITLPVSVTRILPLLERRLNGFVPEALGVIRLLVIAVVIGVSLELTGFFAVRDWLASDRGSALLSGASSALLIVLVASLIWLAFTSWVDYRLNPMLGRPPTARETTLLSLSKNAGTIALIVVTLMIVLSEIGVNIAPLLASAGVLGLAIGFGAQKLVQDIITGIFIQFENAMNVGDVVAVGGISGVVEKLTVRSVSIRDIEGAFHIVPFSSVDLVTNYMRDFAFALVDIGIAYREDITEAKAAMHEAFEALRQDPELRGSLIGDLEWFGLEALGASEVVLRARIRSLPGKQWAVGRAYKEQVKRIFDNRGIEIPFPHRTIYFGEEAHDKAAEFKLRSVTPTTD